MSLKPVEDTAIAANQSTIFLLWNGDFYFHTFPNTVRSTPYDIEVTAYSTFLFASRLKYPLPRPFWRSPIEVAPGVTPRVSASFDQPLSTCRAAAPSDSPVRQERHQSPIQKFCLYF